MIGRHLPSCLLHMTVLQMLLHDYLVLLLLIIVLHDVLLMLGCQSIDQLRLPCYHRLHRLATSNELRRWLIRLLVPLGFIIASRATSGVHFI